MIHTEGLSKTFTRKKQLVHAVKAVDLDIAPGELVAFLGPNGAGKSTTLRMLTSLLRPSAGTAKVVGADVRTEPALVRRRIGYIGQGNGAGHNYRVIDELHVQGSFYGLSPAVSRERADALLPALQLDGLEKRPVMSLSGGQRRRLDVAMGLMNHPALLFLDEPSTGMDPQGRANLWEHITTMREDLGMTLVLTTHYLEEADDMAERVIVIDHGTVIADDSPEQLKLDHADDVVTLSFHSSDEAELAEQALRTDGRHADSLDVRTPETLVITTDHGARKLPSILYLLDAAGAPPAAATIREATLDDVFLHLTGRSLRESTEQDTPASGSPTAANATNGVDAA
ncbi:ABC transporter ATP-binding protein [Streptomyces oceani]|uniref:ABC transporter ATP-binding protein n=1 Tax=Streptomyces oceani TaxID=1075402 RepID=UPI000871CBE0|nr:ABC transporter ATP-binding protein [Streptomyces oceani]